MNNQNLFLFVNEEEEEEEEEESLCLSKWITQLQLMINEGQCKKV
jgi:hypothetical protein